MQVDISTGMTYIHVSPPTIRTLTACLMSLAPAKVCMIYGVFQILVLFKIKVTMGMGYWCPSHATSQHFVRLPCTWVKRNTMREVSRPWTLHKENGQGSKAKALDQEISALPIRPLCLLQVFHWTHLFIRQPYMDILVVHNPNVLVPTFLTCCLVVLCMYWSLFFLLLCWFHVSVWFARCIEGFRSYVQSNK